MTKLDHFFIFVECLVAVGNLVASCWYERQNKLKFAYTYLFVSAGWFYAAIDSCVKMYLNIKN